MIRSAFPAPPTDAQLAELVRQAAYGESREECLMALSLIVRQLQLLRGEVSALKLRLAFKVSAGRSKPC